MQINNNSNISFGIKFSREFDDRLKKEFKIINRFVEEDVFRQRLFISSYGDDNFEMTVRKMNLISLNCA